VGQLTLVRHGQAAFLSDDYDQLSPLGVEQGRALGAFWARHEVQFTHAFVGPCKRHRQTAEAAAAAYAEAGGKLPDFTPAPGLDEFQWDAILAHGLEIVCANEPQLAALRDAWNRAESVGEKRRAIHHLMDALTQRWAEARIQHESMEPFADFRARVLAEIDRMRDAAGRGGHAVAFTSGGPASVTAAHALGLGPTKTIELVWALRNGGLVECLYSGDRFSLSSFNNAPHLDTPALWTYR